MLSSLGAISLNFCFPIKIPAKEIGSCDSIWLSTMGQADDENQVFGLCSKQGPTLMPSFTTLADPVARREGGGGNGLQVKAVNRFMLTNCSLSIVSIFYLLS